MVSASTRLPFNLASRHRAGRSELIHLDVETHELELLKELLPATAWSSS